MPFLRLFFVPYESTTIVTVGFSFENLEKSLPCRNNKRDRYDRIPAKVSVLRKQCLNLRTKFYEKNLCSCRGRAPVRDLTRPRARNRSGRFFGTLSACLKLIRSSSPACWLASRISFTLHVTVLYLGHRCRSQHLCIAKLEQ